MAKRINYRKLAFEHYDPICAYCGFGVPDVLEVAHLDGDRANNDADNLAILCPNCHKMHDIDLIPTEVIVRMRDRQSGADWSKRMKDAGTKDRDAFSVTTLAEQGADAKETYHRMTPDQRLEVMEHLRQVNYGYDPATTRLQKVLEVAQLPRR